MIIYLIKLILCSGFFTAIYYSFLSKDRTFQFNRFYLLGSVIIAIVAPLIVVRTKIIEITSTAVPNSAFEESLIMESTLPQVNQSLLISITELLYISYGAITILLLFRFVKNLFAIQQLKKKGEVINSHDIRVVLIPNITSSFSFLDSMFTCKEEFEKGKLPNEIIEHEKAHIIQKHSYDIIFIELVQCILWFNPFIYFTKKAMKLNHEFLADSKAVKQLGSLKEYQRLILQYASQNSTLRPNFVSHLTFGETKNRLSIMLKTTNKLTAALKQGIAVCIAIAAFFVLGQERTLAQEKKESKAKTEVSSSDPDLSLDVLVNKKERDWKITVDQQKDRRPPPPAPVLVTLKRNSKVRFSNGGEKMIESVFTNLTDAQKNDFIALKNKGEIWIPPRPKHDISTSDLHRFADAEKYDLWIDGKKVGNSELLKYEGKDIYMYYYGVRGDQSSTKKAGKLPAEVYTVKYFENSPESKGYWVPFKKEFIPKPKKITIPDSKNN